MLYCSSSVNRLETAPVFATKARNSEKRTLSMAIKEGDVMTVTALAKEIATLPKSKQKEVMDFVVFLRHRCGKIRGQVRRSSRTPLANEPFVGMWANRSDLADSSVWVRKVRQQEWNR